MWATTTTTWRNTLLLTSLIQISIGKPTSSKISNDMVGNESELNTVRVGDMVLGEDLLHWLRGGNGSVSSIRKIIRYRLWPINEYEGAPTIPYVLDDSVFWYQDVIQLAISHWNKHTCLNIRQKKKSDIHYIKITKSDGCWSYVGREPDPGGQEVSIGEGCQRIDTVIHELGHVVGLIHEHQRPDRDDHIHVNWANVRDDSQDQFIKWDNYLVKKMGIPYDYSSVMQYEPMGFSKNGGLTMSTILPMYQGLLGRHIGLTHRDKRAVNLAYGCIDMWSENCVSKNCEGEGYMGPDCQCICPPGRYGDRCQNVTDEYYVLPSCSKTITKETTLSSPNYPHNISPDTWCVYEIDAPEGFVPLLTFQDFQLYRWDSSCTDDLLQIRHSNDYDGDVMCGELDRGAQILGSISRVLLYLDVKTSRSRGFKMQITWANASNSPDVVIPEPGPGPSLGISNLLHELIISFMTTMFGLLMKICLIVKYLQGNIDVVYNATDLIL